MRSLSRTVSQLATEFGETHASSVIAVVRSSEFASGTLTKSFVPSNVSAPPNRPCALRAAPEIVPSLLAVDASSAVVPLASSKPHAPTSPFGSTAGLDTVTVIVVAVVRLPASSRAIAVSECAPAATPNVFQSRSYGAAVSSAPRSAPSSRNCTPVTPTLSVAVARSVTVPPTVVPSAGAAIDTVGPCVSGGGGSTVVNVQVTGAASAAPSAAVTAVPSRAV